VINQALQGCAQEWCQTFCAEQKVRGKGLLKAVRVFCIVRSVSLECGYGFGIAKGKHAVSLTLPNGLAYSLKNLPYKAVATIASPRREYHNGSAH
jgi:hypothetical protein